jgi:hypothetical protein
MMIIKMKDGNDPDDDVKEDDDDEKQAVFLRPEW